MSLLAFATSFAVMAQEAATAETEVNQYGQKVNSYPVDATVQDGILVFQNKDQNYKMWFDVRVQGDAAVFFGNDKNLNEIGNGMSLRRARFAVKAQLGKNWYGELDTDWTSGTTESRMLTSHSQVFQTLKSKLVTSRRTSQFSVTQLHVISNSWSVRWLLIWRLLVTLVSM